MPIFNVGDDVVTVDLRSREAGVLKYLLPLFDMQHIRVRRRRTRCHVLARMLYVNADKSGGCGRSCLRVFLFLWARQSFSILQQISAFDSISFAIVVRRLCQCNITFPLCMEGAYYRVSVGIQASARMSSFRTWTRCMHEHPPLVYNATFD